MSNKKIENTSNADLIIALQQLAQKIDISNKILNEAIERIKKQQDRIEELETYRDAYLWEN